MMDASTPDLTHPALTLGAFANLKGCRRIFLKNFQVSISMGVHDHEKQARQRIIVNVDLYIDPDGRIRHDTIRETVDYDFVRQAIIEIAESGHFHLQETFCERILDICLDKSGVLAARVSSEKPDVYHDCDSVGFEIFRVK
jgi:dihydroneopterin aldolase